VNKKPKKSQIKKIQKEIDNLRKRLKKLELRPCKNDADILQKENEIEDLKKHIRSLEIKRDRYIYAWWQNNIIVYHGNVKTEKFHRPTCKYFNWKNCTEIFHARKEAIEEGYVPCKICKA
jgi:hypothetical protein